ncbi:MAG TPA: Bax inhibitor-1/YccA family protein [Rhizomicrobium sp.]|nr:Bax inhibitor-1/YccA family protein [Rhizomicrobium sp.]
MADYDNRALQGRAGPVTDVIDQGLRAYMLGVYNYMLVALVLTGLTAYGIAAATTTTDPAQGLAALGHGLYLTSFGVTLYTSPLQWVVMLAPLAMVMFLSFRITHMSAATAQITFWVFSALMGVSLSAIFLAYTSESIAQVFFITAAAFGGLSLWGYTTKSDLTGFGSFLIMGLWGLVIASLVNLFLHSAMTAWVISIAGVGIFSGLTAYDTQKIKEMYYANDDGTLVTQKSIMGALRLYLDFVNLFLSLLRLMGSRR